MIKRKRTTRVVLYASITEAQHESLRHIAFGERRSIADVTREALQDYIQRKSSQYPLTAVEAVLGEEIKVGGPS